MTERTIPILPCRSLPETLDFYRALGFEVTHEEKRPSAYAVVRRGGIELHFFGLRQHDPAASYSTCYVWVADIDALYRAFTDGLRRAYGRLPSRGVPRIGALRTMSYGVRQFIAVDPGGNSIRVGQPVEAGEPSDDPTIQPTSTRLSRALHTATLLGDSKGDHAGATRVLDLAFTADGAEPGGLRVRALILRADLAIRMDDLPLAARLLADADRIELTVAERAALGDDLRRAADLDELLR